MASGVQPGQIIAGKFEVERLLGEGGMGYVVAARHLQLGQTVALKFMREEVMTAAYKARFLREARNTVRLKSRHISRVLDVGSTDGGVPYMVLEYLEGSDLSDLLQARGPFPVDEACEYLVQACEGIAEAHGYGIVHRDLKPANLFLTKSHGGEPFIKVLDFGVSKTLELGFDDSTSPGGRPRTNPSHDGTITRATDLLGSPSYMAPEQIESARQADVQSDLWSLGVILFRLLTGRAPFKAATLGELIDKIMNSPVPDIHELRPELPEGIGAVITRCLERDRKKRVADAAELARMLAPFAGPVASPSLERIALLGPALVTMPTVEAVNPVSTGGRAWSASGAESARPEPMEVPPRPRRVALFGAGLVVAFGVAVLALRPRPVVTSGTTLVPGTNAPVAADVDAAAQAAPVFSTDQLPSIEVTSLPPVHPNDPSSPSSSSSSGRRRPRPRPGGTSTSTSSSGDTSAQPARPEASPPAATGEIPSTRD